jgi:CRP/FNR family cyclic AMP-dependent transcriptional regulator
LVQLVNEGPRTGKEERKMVGVSDLKQFDLFKGFSEKQLSKVGEITAAKKYKKGDIIYKEGAAATHLFVVTKGLVSLRRVEPGKLVGIAFENRERGELFGAAAVMEPKEYTLTALCLEESEVYAIDATKLMKLFEMEPQLGHKCMSAIAQVYFERYKSAKRQIYQMVQTPAIITALPG